MNTEYRGLLAYQHIKELIEMGAIREADQEHLQPASLDLSISGEMYRMRGSYLPQPGESVRDIVKKGMLFPVSLSQPLELNGIYYVRLNESLQLPENISASTNNKSSSGRINLQTRLLANSVSAFDRIPKGYSGDLWLEIIPKSFPVLLGYGERLNQMKFLASDSRLSDDEYRRANDQYGLVRYAGDISPLPDMPSIHGLTLHIDLTSHETIGYQCIPTTTKVLDFTKKDHDPSEFFQPIPRPKDGQLIMRRDTFYIFVTRDAIRVPKEFSVEMMPYDVSIGEFRSHYAGFFDPGWGYGNQGETLGTPGVLEVFTHDRNFVLRDGQPICQMVYEKLSAPASIYYGAPELMNNYYRQEGPRLSKHFRKEEPK
jgi:dCTP deaminase